MFPKENYEHYAIVHLTQLHELQELIRDAWNTILNTVQSNPELMGDPSEARNNGRAEEWIKILTQQFVNKYKDQNCRVFSRSNLNNRDVFPKLKELLFDISVCEMDTTKSLEYKPKRLEYVVKAHWLIESEFNRENIREIILDLSKLMIGAAPNKLFIAAHRDERTEQKLLNRLSPIARCCDSSLYFMFLSHPNDWFTNNQCEPVLHIWSEHINNWEKFPI